MRNTKITCTLLSFAATLGCAVAQSALPQQDNRNIRAHSAAGLPLIFEANHGQTTSQVRFVSKGNGYTAFLTSAGFVLSLRPAQVQESTANGVTGNGSPAANAILSFNLVGASPNPQIIGENPLPGKVNYFIGRDPSHWRTNVPTFASVRYKNIYPGIDLIYYGSHRRLEYDFVISAGADPSQLRLEVGGASNISLNSEGNIVLQTSVGEVNFDCPIVYQESNGVRVPVSGSYVVEDATHVGFHVASYNANKALVIDPVLAYSTYLGGSGYDQANGVVVDGAGNIYIAGFTDSPDFPGASLGPLPGGSIHVFVAKLDPTGSNLIYANYLGGNSQDYGYALTIDAANEVYVTGSTASSDFPMVHPYQGTYPGSFNGFLTKFSADGASLIYSTYLGGNGSDIPAAIAMDSSSDVFVAGNTTSTNFPVMNAFQSTVSPNQGGVYGNYGFLTKFSPDGSSLIYSTYLGGNTNVPYNCGTPCWPSPYNAISAIAVDSSGSVYAGGNTNTYNFPTTAGAFLTTDSTPLQDPVVGFLSKFDGFGSLDYSTYFYGSSGYLSQVNAVAVDAAYSAYLTGAAYSDSTFPITSTTICDPAVYGTGCGYGYITKFNSNGSQLLYSTFLGPNNAANPTALALDANGDAYVLASSNGSSFGLVNGIEQYSGGNDLLLVEIDPLASTELFATYLGGGVDESPAGLAVDSSGSIYVAGTTDSTDLPTTQGALQDMAAGNTDAFVMKIAANSGPAVALSPASLEYAPQAVGSSSPAQTILLRNMGSAPLLISSINTSGDFSESDNCAPSVPAAGSCMLSVIFTPSSSGVRNGTVSLQENAAGSPETIALSGVGSGAGVVLNPSALSFSAQPIGTTSVAQIVTLTNSGNATLDVSTIQTTGDFAETNRCPSSLAAGASCTLAVTFTPTTTGTLAGIMTVTDDAPASPQSVSLSGVGASASSLTATLTPTVLSFGNQLVKTASSIQSVTLTNTSTATMTLGSIRISGDYSQVNTCGAQLSGGAKCVIKVTFAPTAIGVRSGILTVNDNAIGSPQSIALMGGGVDFALSISPNISTIKAGSSSTFAVTISPLGGSVSSVVQLGCGGLPAKISCSFSPSAVTPGAAPGNSLLTISTVASLARANHVRSSGVYALWMQLNGFGLLGMTLLLKAGRKSAKANTLAMLGLLMIGLIAMTACAGGTGIAPNSQTATAPGTYNLTVTGAVGGVQHSIPVTVTID